MKVSKFYCKYHNELEELQIAYNEEKESLKNIGIESFDDWLNCVSQSEIESILGR
jgi:hypothetical protein